MEKQFSYEERCLFAMLKEALGSQKEKTEKFIWEQETPDWQTVFAIADRHVVLPLLYDVLESCSSLSDRDRKQLDTVSRQTVVQNYRLLFLTKYLVNLLEEHQITAVVMKGSATAAFYPTPELRKSGDVDLLIPKKEEFEKACRLFDREKILTRGPQASHHLSYETEEGIEIEVHTHFSEPFDQRGANQYIKQKLDDCTEHIIKTSVMGVELPFFDRPYHGFQLLLHMLQHFLSAGFGLKLLCDWVMLWQQPWTEEEKACIYHMVSECRICQFADMITSVCTEVLGLDAAQTPFSLLETELVMEFLREVLEAEEFGYSDQDRSVAMKGTKARHYAVTVHHQMKLCYPKAKSWVPLWPVLWLLTVISFLKRRRGHVLDIIKKTKKRSTLREQLQLFQR